MAFLTSEILPSKNNVKQTDRSLAKRQNNGDTPPYFQKPEYHCRFSQNEFFLTEDFWERTHDDCDGKILRVTTIERFFCFRPLAFATRINNLL